MRFLYPTGGKIPESAGGVLVTPSTRGIPTAISQGQSWAGDNQAFTKGFDETRFFPWLYGTMAPFKATCLFVTVPDVVGDAQATLDLFQHYRRDFGDWPVAFVAQDGQELLSLPDDFDVLFVGGSTEWKESRFVIRIIKQAQELEKQIHIGRVNWGRRYRLFSILKGSNLFTCDGTRPRFEGIEKTRQAWEAYTAQKPLLTI